MLLPKHNPTTFRCEMEAIKATMPRLHLSIFFSVGASDLGVIAVRVPARQLCSLFVLGDTANTYSCCAFCGPLRYVSLLLHDSTLLTLCTRGMSAKAFGLPSVAPPQRLVGQWHQLLTTDFDIIEDIHTRGWDVATSFEIRYKHLLLAQAKPDQPSSEDIDRIMYAGTDSDGDEEYESTESRLGEQIETPSV